MTVPSRIAASAWCVLVALAGAGSVQADGAFPDEFSIHFPPANPDRIIVGANFGVMISEDRGATWRYVCEPYVTEDSSDPLALINVIFYQVGAADGEILQVANNYKLRRSGDDGCSWTTATGALGSLQAIDFFPSRTDSQFVLAIGVDPTGAGSSLVASHDGGATFDPPLATNTLSKQLFSSVEISGTTVYATVTAAGVAQLWRSDDSGATWANKANLPMLPGGIVPQAARIMAIDPEDATIAYVRLLGGAYDAIAIATAGGQSTTVKLQLMNSAFSAFARGTDKTLYAGTPDGKLYVRPPPSQATPDPDFAAPITGPHFRCLGQRFATNDLYACGYFFQDGFSLGVSQDHGQTFHKVMSLPEMLGPLTCSAVQTKCAAHWARIQSVFNSDGGTGGGGGGGGGQQPGGGGGGCATIGVGSVAVLAFLAFALRRVSRRTF